MVRPLLPCYLLRWSGVGKPVLCEGRRGSWEVERRCGVDTRYEGGIQARAGGAGRDEFEEHDVPCKEGADGAEAASGGGAAGEGGDEEEWWGVEVQGGEWTVETATDTGETVVYNGDEERGGILKGKWGIGEKEEKEVICNKHFKLIGFF